jgi:hypothetical protein
MSIYDPRYVVYERKKRCCANKKLEEKKFCTLVRRPNSEIFGIAARVDMTPSQLSVCLDSSELESNATSSAVATEVFADIWTSLIIFLKCRAWVEGKYVVLKIEGLPDSEE